MSSDGNDEFDVPSAPPPFKGLEKDKVETRKRQALFLRQALRIVERFAHNPVNTDMLAYAVSINTDIGLVVFCIFDDSFCFINRMYSFIMSEVFF